jgi:putative lysine transport system substrate-binding protein
MKKHLLALLLALAMVFSLCACGSSSTGTASTGTTDASASADASESSDGTYTLRVGMDCAYAPYCWTQDDDSNGAVQIKDSNEYVCGYDVEIAKKICETYGWNLEIIKIDWDGLILALNANKIDCIIDGMGVTEERLQSVNFSDYYWSSEQVMVVRKDSQYANATSLEDFAGAKVTSQLNSMWMDLISQIPDVDEQPGLSGTPELFVAVSSGKIDATILGETEAYSGCLSNPDLTYVKFDEGKGFEVNQADCSSGIAVRKDDDELLAQLNDVIATLDSNTQETMMQQALDAQPLTAE